MTDFGVDLAALPDLDPLFSLVSGRAVLLEAIARRLRTPRGALFYDPEYGLDLTGYVNESLSRADALALEAALAAECRKDERIRAAGASVAFEPATRTLRITVRLFDDAGPFELVLSVDRVTVQLLRAALSAP